MPGVDRGGGCRARMDTSLGEVKAQGQWETGVQHGNLAGSNPKQIWGTTELHLEKKE